jgi:hypothetical protein
MTLQDAGHYVEERNLLSFYFENTVRTLRWAACLRDRGKNLRRAEINSCIPKRPWAFEHTHPLLTGYLGLIPGGQSDRFVKLTNPQRLIPLLLIVELSVCSHIFLHDLKFTNVYGQ